MTATFLGKYVNLKAHELYLFLLVVKYKDIRLFSKIFSNTQLSEDIISQLDKEFAMNQIPEIRACITRILRNETIGKCVFDVLDGAGNIIFRKMEVSYVELEQKKQLGLFLKYRSRIEDINTTQSTFLPLDFNWGGLLFYDDLIRWEEIKDYTLAQYLYQQLEMFEFAILSDIGKEEII